MRHRLPAALTLLAALTLTTAASVQSDGEVECSYDAYNCGDFDTCAEVRRVFDACPTDVHGLDRDNDGVPCESLCD
jgi:hypothetical protein